LSQGAAGNIRAGDRLPWVQLEETQGGEAEADNYAALKSLDWQVHCYGEPSHDLRGFCERRAIVLYAFAWKNAMAKAGFKRNAAYLIRPDGYVAMADVVGQPASLEQYLAQ
jgi:hypothetical protein